ncbi:uncharacterized protein HaLaN_02182 [Haematococcus lacustris]|uniref:Uncharacterized protein n=1 Tax=Haematococcus lacustris TaxID=44745 RepID=A0A699YB39_HAELA|nr:uncharacterized protein HaLaN_02182 [Haematococcus lacustris]
MGMGSALTSGEMAHRCLALRPSPWWQALGHRVLHLTWSGRGPVSLQGLGLQVVAEPEEADFILAHGTEAQALPAPAPATDHSQVHGQQSQLELEGFEALLARCAEVGRARGAPLPMVVANPDLVTVDGSALTTMPGTLAAMYSKLGGEVQLMGKPSPLIYQACLEELGLEPAQVLAVGDSLEHDIRGAAAAGIHSLFIGGGIHADLAGAACRSEWRSKGEIG